MNKESASLTVSKLLSNAAEIPAQQMKELQELSFTFVLKRDGQIVKKAGYKLYSPGVVEPVQRLTADDGTFQLKIGQRAVFETVATGTYTVEEVYQEYNGKPFFVVDGSIKEGTVDLENQKGFTFTFENTLDGIFDLQLFKDDQKTGAPLEGAAFKLEKLNSQGMPDTSTPAVKLVSDEKGIARAVDLQTGSYMLTETEAPAGYSGLSEPIRFDVTMDSDSGELVLTYRNTVSDGINDICTEGEKQTLIREDESGNALVKPLAVLTIHNHKPIVLPESGGMGTEVFTLSGALLIGMSLLALAWKRRERS